MGWHCECGLGGVKLRLDRFGLRLRLRQHEAVRTVIESRQHLALFTRLPSLISTSVTRPLMVAETVAWRRATT